MRCREILRTRLPRRLATWGIVLTLTAADRAWATTPAPAPPRTPVAVSADDAFSIPEAGAANPYGPRSQRTPKLTVQQILRYALENPLVQAAREGIEAMQAQLRKAKFAWVPIIETSASLSPGVRVQCQDIPLAQDPSDPSAGPIDFQYCSSQVDGEVVDVQTLRGYFDQLGKAGVRFEVRADAVFPLFTFGKIRNAKRAATVGVTLAKLVELQARDETIKRVLQAHVTLLLARESIGILHEARDVVERARRRVDEDLGGGDDFDVDLSTVEASRDPDDRFKLDLAEVDLQQRMREARKVEALALGALWGLAGAAAPPDFDVTAAPLRRFSMRSGMHTLEHFKQLAWNHRPEAKMATAAVALRTAQSKLARANFLPDFGVAVTAAYAVSSAADRNMKQLYYVDVYNYARLMVSLAMRWRLDFHNDAFDLQKARAELRQAEFQRQAAKLLLGREVEEAYLALIDAEHDIELTRQATDTSWKLVVSQEIKDSSGGGDSGELVRALERWYTWRFKHVEAIQAYNQALAMLQRAVGTDLVELPSAGPRSSSPDRPQSTAP